MSHGPAYRVPFRRRRTNKTDYRARLKLLSSSLPRAVVRKSLRQITVQIVEYNPAGDKVLASAVSKELARYGWSGSSSSTPAAYLVGMLVAKRALKKGVDNVVLDIGLNTPSKGARVFAVLKGLADGGLTVPHDPEIMPSEERIVGKVKGDEVVKAFGDVKSKLEALK
jgi:large subunit ribosomal protein L18